MFGAITNALGKFGMKNAFAGGARGVLGQGSILARDLMTGMRGYAASTRRSVYGAMAGAAAGGAYGAASDDTSVLGGALAGAGLGGLGARYLGAGVRRAGTAGRGMGLMASGRDYASKFGRGVWGQMRRDFSGVTLAANKGINAFKGMGRAGGGFTGGAGI